MLIAAHASQHKNRFVLTDARDGRGCRDGIVNKSWRSKLQARGEVNTALPRQLIADHIRDQTRDQRPVCNALLEPGFCGKCAIQMQGVVIARNFGKRHNVRLGDGFGHAGGITNFEGLHDPSLREMRGSRFGFYPQHLSRVRLKTWLTFKKYRVGRI
jgi:hypothetical protein